MNKPFGWRSRLKKIIVDRETADGINIDQKEIAQNANVSENTLSAWMNPARVSTSLRFDTLYQIAKAINVHPSDLIEFVGVDWQYEEIDTDPELKTPLPETMTSHLQEAEFAVAPS